VEKIFLEVDTFVVRLTAQRNKQFSRCEMMPTIESLKIW